MIPAIPPSVWSVQPLGFSAPVELFDGPYTLDLMGHQREDVAPDGRQFLMVENSRLRHLPPVPDHHEVARSGIHLRVEHKLAIL